jgi:hypothetical protein
LRLLDRQRFYLPDLRIQSRVKEDGHAGRNLSSDYGSVDCVFED